MFNRFTPLTLLALSVLLAFPAPQTYAVTAIRDEANLFRPATEAEAFKILRDIESRTGMDTLVEVVASLPADVRDRVDAQPDQRGATLRQWAEGRARQEQVGGVYIGIAKSPGTLQIEPSGKAGRLLPKAELDGVVTTMKDAFKAGDFDRGLIAGLSEMRDRMTANVGAAGAPVERTGAAKTEGGGAAANGRSSSSSPVPTGGGGFGLGACVVPLLIGIVIVFVLRKVFAGKARQAGYGQQGFGGPPPMPGQQGGNDPRYGNQPGYGGPGMGGGGGGFGRGIAGGLLGGLAGGYLYDRMSGGGSAHGAPTSSDPNALGGGGGGGASDAGQGDGGGGFFGDSGGGSDFGGGDSGGGGDFGGGDGGGGDF